MTDNIKNVDVIIAGAGLTGLTLAYYVQKSGKSVLLLERSGRTGGVISSEREDDFIYETGPNSGVLGSMEAVNLFNDLKEHCRLETAREESKKRLIWKGNSWKALPSGLLSAITTPLFTWHDKFFILGEPWRKKGNNPNESMASLVKRRLGRSFLDYAVDPFISGIYAGNPENIVTKYAMPKLYNLENEYGSFVKGSIQLSKTRDKSIPKPSREVFSIEGGLGNLITALTNSIGRDNIILNCNEMLIEPENGKFIANVQSQGIEYKIFSEKAVTTVSAHSLPAILKFIAINDMSHISNLEYAKVVQVILGFKHWNGIKLDAFGGLIPSVEKRKLLGVLFSSSLFSQRAPENGALLSIFMGGARHPEYVNLNDSAIMEMVSQEIPDLMKLKEFDPNLVKVFRYQYAIPQYDASSGKRLDIVAKIEAEYPGLFIAGNLKDGIGMSDRIKQAFNVAQKISN